MAKSKVKDSEVLAYLQERKQALRDELEKIETMLSVVGANSKSAIKKGKKRGKKKLEKAVKSIRKKVTQAIEGAKTQTEKLVGRIVSSDAEETGVKKRRAVSDAPLAADAPKRTRSRQVAKPASSASAAVETDQVTTKQEPVKKAVATKASKVPTPASPKPATKKATGKTIPVSFDPKAKMDDKIRFALAQKKGSTKAEVIDYLNNLDPEYGLTKLKKVVAFRLNHLLKTGQVKGSEHKDGFRYAN
ncbi:hypothetical protein GCM10007415_13650 [Parapedobacter pyrenivorans]|uniref:Uncharacterized protein n=1 Tax=Parapedobacter pyrenivorans TaxID=1305674 RepID=A0A917HK33_9SPHI|nr:hypothetical protein [Parapedobacter pyrenivorans]GGG82126.1 hypothetical protein GCM10007415_13650 [Parapedobacter pyrenivorans]